MTKPRMLTRKRVMIRLVLLSCIATVARAQESSTDYQCLKYEGTLQFGNKIALRQFSVPFPDTRSLPGPDGAGAIMFSTSDLSSCSNQDLLCVREHVRAGDKGVEDFIYAVPRRLTIGDVYRAGGIEFHSYYSFQVSSSPPSAIVVAQGEPLPGKPVRYKMLVEQGVGIRELYFELLHSQFTHSFEDSLQQLPDVTCTLLSKKGLLADVRVSQPPKANNSR